MSIERSLTVKTGSEAGQQYQNVIVEYSIIWKILLLENIPLKLTTILNIVKWKYKSIKPII